MSSGYGELTSQAHELLAAGDLVGAQELLHTVLDGADPSPANASPELAEAASLQAQVLVRLGKPEVARSWGAFAHAAATRLHGPSDPRTVAAAATLAAILHRVGSNARAAQLYRKVITELTATDGPESLRVLAAHADLATVDYARGNCEPARNRLENAWQLHREVYGEGQPSGIKMLARLGAMYRDCGLAARAQAHLALARRLCREHLFTDHPLALQVAALAEAAADPDHACAGREPGRRADIPAPSAPPSDQASPPSGSIGTGPEPRVPPPRSPNRPTPPYQPPTRPTRSSVVPPPREGTEDGYGDPDATLRPVDQPDASPVDEPAEAEDLTGDRWPPEADPVEPAPSGEADPDGVRTLRSWPEPPVALSRPPASSDRRMLPLLVAGLVVALIGTGAVVAASVDTEEPERPARRPSAPSQSLGPSSGASPSPTISTAAPGTPPTDVRLHDNRNSITLTWSYPTGAEGPVLISGGRTGQQPQAFQELAPGSTRFVLYGLPERIDYCFYISVVYSAEQISRAGPVCTTRSRSSPAR